jgi:hypothetical protein
MTLYAIYERDIEADILVGLFTNKEVAESTLSGLQEAMTLRADDMCIREFTVDCFLSEEHQERLNNWRLRHPSASTVR